MIRFLFYVMIFLSSCTTVGAELGILERVAKFGEKFLIQATNSNGPWDDEDNPRKMHDACECGHDKRQLRDNYTSVKPWHMYLIGSFAKTVFCTGTIIASNLLVTSHDCLQKPENSYNVFDAWFPRPDDSNMFTPESIIISKLSNNLDLSYKIVRIIYNHRYAINMATNAHPTDNLVIFQVTPEFTKDPDLSPICIPEVTDPIGDELTGKNAYYYGLMVGRKSREARYWDFVAQCNAELTTTSTTTTTTTKPVTTSTVKPVETPATTEATSDGTDSPFTPPSSPPPAQVPDTIFGIIVPEDQCTQEARDKENQLLCLQRLGRPVRPKWGDGIIYVTSQAKDKRNFLIGAAATIPFASDGSYELMNFSKISKLIKYIEYHAARSGTHWCRSEKLVLPDELLSERRGKERTTNSGRDDSLNCICGKMRDILKQDGNARRDEFPWVALVTYSPNGPGRNEKLCSGVVINNRVVITSASRCLTDDKTNRQVNPRHLTVHADLGRKGVKPKTVSQIIRHPNFASNRGSIQKSAVDIGLLILREPLTFVTCGNGFRPICFPSSSTANLITDEIKLLSGFNILDPSPIAADAIRTLQKMTRPLLPETWCHNATNNFKQGEMVRKLCTDKRKNTGGLADKGSPLQVERHGNYLVQHILLGIYDFDSTQIRGFKMPNGTDSPEDYAFYVDVREHIAFVDQHSKEHGAKWCRAEMDVTYVQPSQNK